MLIEKAVLVYALPEERREAVASALGGLAVLFIAEEKAGLTVSELLSLSPEIRPARLSEPMAVFHGLTSPELDAALSALRESGAGITLRAITTPTNLGWSGNRLQADLSAEREALKRHRKAHKAHKR